MVLYYGLFALEAANNSIAATTRTRSTTNIPRLASDRSCLSQKQKYSSNSIAKMPTSSVSSSNSWIYTEDLRKRFEERYADCRYVFVPVYIDRKSARHNHSTTGISPQRSSDRENSWMYSRSLRDRLFYSTSKISLPLTTNISSSACCVTNHGFTRDELPVKKDFKSRLFKRSFSAKDRTRTNMSLSSSVSSFSTTNNLVKHRTSDVVEEEDDEGVANENHSIPLIEHDSMVPSTTRPTVVSSNENNAHLNEETTSDLVRSSSAFARSKSSIKDTTRPNKKLTRLRSFFSRRSTSTPSRAQEQQQQQQHLQMTLSNRISRT